MNNIERFANLFEESDDVLELANVKSYYRNIAGKRTYVKESQRKSDGKANKSVQKDQGPSIDNILASRVPVVLSPLQRYELASRAKALRKILDNRVLLEKSKSKQLKLAIEVINSRAHYYEQINNPQAGYNDREAARLDLAQKMLDLKNTLTTQQTQQAVSDQNDKEHGGAHLQPGELINENNARPTSPNPFPAKKKKPASKSNVLGTPLPGSAKIDAKAIADARPQKGII